MNTYMFQLYDEASNTIAVMSLTTDDVYDKATLEKRLAELLEHYPETTRHKVFINGKEQE